MPINMTTDEFQRLAAENPKPYATPARPTKKTVADSVFKIFNIASYQEKTKAQTTVYALATDVQAIRAIPNANTSYGRLKTPDGKKEDAERQSSRRPLVWLRPNVFSKSHSVNDTGE